MTSGTEHGPDRSQDQAATENPSQRWLDELASVDLSPIDQAIARSEARDRELKQAELARERQRELDRDIRLLNLEHKLGRLVSQIDELTDDLRSANDNLHNEQRSAYNNLDASLRNSQEIASQIARNVEALESRHSLRPEIRFLVLVMMLLALIITALASILLNSPSVPPRAQLFHPPLTDAPPPRFSAPLELTPPPSRLSPPPS